MRTYEMIPNIDFKYRLEYVTWFMV